MNILAVLTQNRMGIGIQDGPSKQIDFFLHSVFCLLNMLLPRLELLACFISFVSFPGKKSRIPHVVVFLVVSPSLGDIKISWAALSHQRRLPSQHMGDMSQMYLFVCEYYGQHSLQGVSGF